MSCQLNCVNEYTIKIKINAWEKTKNKIQINQSSHGTEITMSPPSKRHQKTEGSSQRKVEYRECGQTCFVFHVNNDSKFADIFSVRLTCMMLKHSLNKNVSHHNSTVVPQSESRTERIIISGISTVHKTIHLFIKP